MAKYTDVKQFYRQSTNAKLYGDQAPPVPHLGLRLTSQNVHPLEPGTVMFIIKDPRKINGVFEMVFEYIKFKNDAPVEVHFKIPSDKPNSTRKLIMHLQWMGDYRSWSERQAKAINEANAETQAKQKGTEDITDQTSNIDKPG